MIYLIGVDHQLQHNGNNCAESQKRSAFVQYLVNKIKELNISLIAEEFNFEALGKSQGTNSSCKIAAQESGIEHRFCDPTTSERESIRIPSKNKIIMDLFGKPKKILNHIENKQVNDEERMFFTLREKFWIDKIKDKNQENVIFICGKDHIVSFKSLVNKEGFDAEELKIEI
ncbi:MAG: hypothetical protein WCD80_14055 [Desulfobaccales bacterium]